MIDAVADVLRMFAAASVAPGRLPAGAAGLQAVGWATVDLERAIVQLAGALGVPETAFVDAAGSAALGAHCRIAREPVIDGLRLAILEPSTEGRLAAALARWDEGPLVAWYVPSAPVDGQRAVLPGPFGPERLVGGDPLTGPHRLVVVTGTGTIPA